MPEETGEGSPQEDTNPSRRSEEFVPNIEPRQAGRDQEEAAEARNYREPVYDLCDSVNTTQVIAGKIQKPPDYTSAVIGNLRRKGLVKTVESAGNKVYEQTF